MGQTERPQSEIGGRVGDAAQTEFNRVDALQNHDLTKVKLKQHNNNQDSNNRKTRRPKMQETWVWKGDAMELALNESNKTQER